MTTPTMTIDGVEYVEATPQDCGKGGWDHICAQCALGQPGMLARCADALHGAADAAFGGVCAERDVIYIRKA